MYIYSAVKIILSCRCKLALATVILVKALIPLDAFLPYEDAKIPFNFKIKIRVMVKNVADFFISIFFNTFTFVMY